MTGKERITRILKRQPVDRIGIYEHFWNDTYAEYIAKGKIKEGENFDDHFGFDMSLAWVFHLPIDLDFKDEIVSETEDTVVIKDGNGAILRRHKKHDTTPEHVDFTIKTCDEWEKVKHMMLEADDRRINFEEYRKAKAAAAKAGRFFAPCALNVFECMHLVSGHENLLMGMALDPEWVTDMAQTYANLIVKLFTRLFEREGYPDGLFLYEDLGFKERPFMSPTMYEEILMPSHKCICDFAHSHDLPVMIHSCGFVEPLLPLMIKTGMDCLHAIEIKSGMDLLHIHHEYGDKIVLFGGIDVRALYSNDKEKIDAELEEKIPIIMQGYGYIAHSDHSIPKTVDYETLKYYIDKVLQLGTYKTILKNPIIKGFHPDPSICYDEKSGNYYLVTSTFEFFPGVPIFKSRDLINWVQVGHCLSRESQLPLEKAKPSDGIYAPTIRVHNGRFYMVTTNIGTSSHIMVHTDNPEGEWSEPIFITPETSDFNIWGIDPSLFFDDDGKVYFSFTENGIKQCEIDITTGICKQWKPLWSGTGQRFPEAPHLYKINGKYYLMIAEGGTDIGHRVSIARSDSPWGPFEPCPHNPILSNQPIHTTLDAVGHGDLIQDLQGKWWMVFLGFRYANPYFHHLGRETLIAPVEWNDDGWPVVNKTGTIDYETVLDREVNLHKWQAKPVRDTFEKRALNWVHLRNPQADKYLFGDGLTLIGSDLPLSSATGSPTMLLSRQQHFDMRISAKFNADLPNAGDEVGLTVYYDFCHHYDFYLTRKDDGVYLVVRKTIGDLSAQVYCNMYDGNETELTIRANKDSYYFEHNGIKCATGLTQYVSTEATTISFTGVMVGMFAVGKTAKGHFEWFEEEEAYD